MCGLWGSFAESGTLSTVDYQRALTLATLSELRGMDSSGYVSLFVNDRREACVHHDKDVVTASQLVYANPAIHHVATKYSLFGLLGHSRAATVGSVNKENAHPFKCGHILGMHNGTVSKLGSDDKTDSQEIFEMIADHGLVETLKEIKYGAYCLVYVDYKDNSLNIIKNKDRPLTLSRSSAGVWFWSSEWQMLEFMQKRFNGITYASAITPKENELFRFDLVTRQLTRKEIDLYPAKYTYRPSVPALPAPKKKEEQKSFFDRKPDVEDVEEQDDPSIYVGLSRKQKRKLRQQRALERKAKKEQKPPFQATPPGPNEKIVYRGFRDRPMSESIVTKLLSKGCKIYGTPASINDKVYWISQDGFICAKAVEDGGLQDFGIKEVYLGKYNPKGF